MGIDYVFPEGYDFTYCHNPEDHEPPKVQPTRASRTMKPESHPWLQFRDASKQEKIIFNNKLAEIQNYNVSRPKQMDWHLLARLGVVDDLRRMMRTVAFASGSDRDRMEWVDVDLWGRIFRLGTPTYRELCLEFYSTLEVEPVLMTTEITRKQTIHFRLGGRQRHCSVLGFAYLTGMFTADEMRTHWMHEYLQKGAFDTSRFHDDKTFDQYWFEISGEGAHDAHKSKLSQIRSKRLRLMHKMITNSFLHRGDNNNKVYLEDLWLLRYFSELTPGKHVCAPYLLARHMYRCKEKRILCGHFIGEIASRLGLWDRIENRNLGNPVTVQLMGELDLVKAKLLNADKTRLLEDDEAPAPARRTRRRAEQAEPDDEDDDEDEEEAPQMGPRPYDFSDLRGDIQQLSEHQAFMIEQQRYFSSQQRRLEYTMDYYRPVWHNQMEQMYQARPNEEDRRMPNFSPPELYTPRQFQSDYPYPPHSSSGGASGSHPHASSSFAGDAGASGSGAGGAAYDPMAYDPYGASLFGVVHGAGGDGVPSAFGAPPEFGQ